MIKDEYYTSTDISKGLNVAPATAYIYLCRPEFNEFVKRCKRGELAKFKYRWCKELVMKFNKVYNRPNKKLNIKDWTENE